MNSKAANSRIPKINSAQARSFQGTQRQSHQHHFMVHSGFNVKPFAQPQIS
jgi:hypothetical protein